jgi:hypothetical protein
MKILLMLLLAASCSQSNLKSSMNSNSAAQNAADAHSASSEDPDVSIDQDYSSNPNQSANKSPDESEQANRPGKISGSYLYCVPLFNNEHLPNNSSIGCRLNDATGIKVDPKRLAKSFIYRFDLEPDEDIKVVVRRNQQDVSSFDAFLDLTTKNKITAAAAIDKIQIKVELHGLLDGGADVSGSLPLRTVLQEGAQPASNRSWSESCSNAVCEYRDDNTGLYWSTFHSVQVYQAANVLCKLAGNSSRLPSANEMFVARANSIANNAYSGSMGAQDAYVWTSDPGLIANELIATRIAINPANPNAKPADQQEIASFGYICVHE